MQQVYSFSLFCIPDNDSEPRGRGTASARKLQELVYLTEELPEDKYCSVSFLSFRFLVEPLLQ